MAAAVALDLLARPGIAGHRRAGRAWSSSPRPVRAVRRRIAVLRRYRELLRLARREGFGPLLVQPRAVERSTEATGVRLRRLLEEAGGVYVKLGQIAATRVDLVPPEVCAELARLQNQVAAGAGRADPAGARGRARTTRRRGVRRVRLGAPGRGLDRPDLPRPAAHRRAGRREGPAPRHRGRRWSATSPRSRCWPTSRSGGRRSARACGPARCSTSSRSSLRAELDFRREADAMDEMRTLLGPDSRRAHTPGLRGAAAPVACSCRSASTASRSPTVRRWPRRGIDRAALADELLRSMLEQVLTVGFFHADPHPGNVFVFEDGTLGLIDFGAVGRLDPIQQTAVVDMMAAWPAADVEPPPRRDRAGGRDGRGRAARAARARVRSPHGRSRARHRGTVDPSILQDLVATLSEFGIRLPGDLVILSRALVTLDGTLGIIAPASRWWARQPSQLTALGGSAIVDPQTIVRQRARSRCSPTSAACPTASTGSLMLAGRGDLRVRSVSTRTPAASCGPS